MKFQKAIIVFICFFLAILAFSCKPGGGGEKPGNFIIDAPEVTIFKCGGGYGTLDQYWDYEIRVFTYNSQNQPIQYGETVRERDKKGTVELTNFKFPETGVFFIQITARPRYCKLISYNECNSGCARYYAKYTSGVLERIDQFRVTQNLWLPDGWDCCS